MGLELGKVLSDVKLKVEDAKQRDAIKGIARINQKTMQNLEISTEDVIEIVGKKKTSAIVRLAHLEDQNREVIRIDESIRKNAGISINEYVLIRKAEAKNAVNIKLAPVDMRLNPHERFIRFVKNKLMGRTFIEGDVTLIKILGHDLFFIVIETQPSEIVRMMESTSLQILSEPAPEIEGIEEIKLTESERKILEYVTVHNYKIHISECATELGKPIKEIEETFKSLEQKRLLKKKDVN
jgi:transitional endoplasmic reticulum ATPase